MPLEEQGGIFVSIQYCLRYKRQRDGNRLRHWYTNICKKNEWILAVGKSVYYKCMRTVSLSRAKISYRAVYRQNLRISDVNSYNRKRGRSNFCSFMCFNKGLLHECIYEEHMPVFTQFMLHMWMMSYVSPQLKTNNTSLRSDLLVIM